MLNLASTPSASVARPSALHQHHHHQLVSRSRSWQLNTCMPSITPMSPQYLSFTDALRQQQQQQEFSVASANRDGTMPLQQQQFLSTSALSSLPAVSCQQQYWAPSPSSSGCSNSSASITPTKQQQQHHFSTNHHAMQPLPQPAADEQQTLNFQKTSDHQSSSSVNSLSVNQRRMSIAFALFARVSQPHVRDLYPNYSENDILQMLNNLWKQLTPSKREAWLNAAMLPYNECSAVLGIGADAQRHNPLAEQQHNYLLSLAAADGGIDNNNNNVNSINTTTKVKNGIYVNANHNTSSDFLDRARIFIRNEHDQQQLMSSTAVTTTPINTLQQLMGGNASSIRNSPHHQFLFDGTTTPASSSSSFISRNLTTGSNVVMHQQQQQFGAHTVCQQHSSRSFASQMQHAPAISSPFPTISNVVIPSTTTFYTTSTAKNSRSRTNMVSNNMHANSRTLAKCKSTQQHAALSAAAQRRKSSAHTIKSNNSTGGGSSGKKATSGGLNNKKIRASNSNRSGRNAIYKTSSTKFSVAPSSSEQLITSPQPAALVFSPSLSTAAVPNFFPSFNMGASNYTAAAAATAMPDIVGQRFYAVAAENQQRYNVFSDGQNFYATEATPHENGAAGVALGSSAHFNSGSSSGNMNNNTFLKVEQHVGFSSSVAVQQQQTNSGCVANNNGGIGDPVNNNFKPITFLWEFSNHNQLQQQQQQQNIVKQHYTNIDTSNMPLVISSSPNFIQEQHQQQQQWSPTIEGPIHHQPSNNSVSEFESGQYSYVAAADEQQQQYHGSQLQSGSSNSSNGCSAAVFNEQLYLQDITPCTSPTSFDKYFFREHHNMATRPLMAQLVGGDLFMGSSVMSRFNYVAPANSATTFAANAASSSNISTTTTSLLPLSPTTPPSALPDNNFSYTANNNNTVQNLTIAAQPTVNAVAAAPSFTANDAVGEVFHYSEARTQNVMPLAMFKTSESCTDDSSETNGDDFSDSCCNSIVSGFDGNSCCATPLEPRAAVKLLGQYNAFNSGFDFNLDALLVEGVADKSLDTSDAAKLYAVSSCTNTTADCYRESVMKNKKQKVQKTAVTLPQIPCAIAVCSRSPPEGAALISTSNKNSYSVLRQHLTAAPTAPKVITNYTDVDNKATAAAAAAAAGNSQAFFANIDFYNNIQCPLAEHNISLSDPSAKLLPQNSYSVSQHQQDE